MKQNPFTPEQQKRAAETRHKAQEARQRLPRCTIVRPGDKDTPSRVCGARTSQNDAEKARGVYWCPACQKYPWGSGGGRHGGGPDKVPAAALVLDREP